jgi:hypothetical protein
LLSPQYPENVFTTEAQRKSRSGKDWIVDEAEAVLMILFPKALAGDPPHILTPFPPFFLPLW